MQPILNVHIVKSPQTESIDFLKQKLDSNIAVSLGNKSDIPLEASILIEGNPNREMLIALTNLKSVIIPWAGASPETLKLMRDFPQISLHNLHHNALPVAEYALALLLAAANTLIPVDRAMRNNDWRPRYDRTPSILISGKTALILGYGHIAKALIKLLSGFEMTLMATRNSSESINQGELVTIYPSSSLHELLPKADFLIVTLPLTPITKGLIGEKELSLLPNHAIVVNIGRGAIIDQAALYNALKMNTISAAGIDVWYKYPEDGTSEFNTPPSDYPFNELDNIVMSPHRAGSLNQKDIEILRMTHLAELLNQAARGYPMPNQVDLDKGY
jgi:phosphoglycerate dehydrogenase-like enzyme